MSVGKAEPRRIIGTVNTAEFLVSVSASAGFVVGMGSELSQNWQPVVGLLVGGAIAAPIAAWIVTIMKPEVLGGVVGALLMLLNSSRLVNYFGFLGVVAVILIGLAVIVALVVVRKRSLLERSLTGDDVPENSQQSTSDSDAVAAERSASGRQYEKQREQEREKERARG